MIKTNGGGFEGFYVFVSVIAAMLLLSSYMIGLAASIAAVFF